MPPLSGSAHRGETTFGRRAIVTPQPEVALAIQHLGSPDSQVKAFGRSGTVVLEASTLDEFGGDELSPLSSVRPHHHRRTIRDRHMRGAKLVHSSVTRSNCTAGCSDADASEATLRSASDHSHDRGLPQLDFVNYGLSLRPQLDCEHVGGFVNYGLSLRPRK